MDIAGADHQRQGSIEEDSANADAAAAAKRPSDRGMGAVRKYPAHRADAGTRQRRSRNGNACRTRQNGEDRFRCTAYVRARRQARGQHYQGAACQADWRGAVAACLYASGRDRRRISPVFRTGKRCSLSDQRLARSGPGACRAGCPHREQLAEHRTGFVGACATPVRSHTDDHQGHACWSRLAAYRPVLSNAGVAAGPSNR